MKNPKKKEITKNSKTDDSTLSPQELSKYIRQLSAAAKNVTGNKYLTEDAMILLLHNAMPPKHRISLRRIQHVLEAMQSLEDVYCK